MERQRSRVKGDDGGFKTHKPSLIQIKSYQIVIIIILLAAAVVSTCFIDQFTETTARAMFGCRKVICGGLIRTPAEDDGRTENDALINAIDQSDVKMVMNAERTQAHKSRICGL